MNRFNMVHNFLEGKFGDKFCFKKIRTIKQLINSSTSFTIVGMPGVGVTIFLKYLVTTKLAYFIYVDSYLLTNLTKAEFLKLLLRELGEESLNDEYLFERCILRLKELSLKCSKIVLIFNRFDQLHSIFDETFFSNIWALRNVNPEKIVIISTVNTPFREKTSGALESEHRGIFSRIVYLRPYSPEDIKKIISTYSENRLIMDKGVVILAQNLSGGHHQLLQLLLKSARLSNPLQDQFVKLQLKELFEFVSYRQRMVLRKIALGKNPGRFDEYLLEIGMVKWRIKKNKKNSQLELFTPLLGEYITRHHPKRLPVKEAKLFNLLKQNLGEIVSKEEIFHTIWSNGKPDDRTLNSLIYRMKKNPAFLASGFVIENHKKEGYILFKN